MYSIAENIIKWKYYLKLSLLIKIVGIIIL